MAPILTRLLIASSQAGSLIGKQGSQIKSIQDGSGANVRVIPTDDLSFCALPDDRIVEIQSETSKVQKALEKVVGHLRRYLVDRSILPLFEQKPQAENGAPNSTPGTWGKMVVQPLSSSRHSGLGTSVTSAFKADPLYPTRDTQIESQAHHRGLSLYGKDPGPVGLRSSLSAPSPAPVITQIIQKMQIPLSYADDVIGVEGTNIGYFSQAGVRKVDIKNVGLFLHNFWK